MERIYDEDILDWKSLWQSYTVSKTQNVQLWNTVCVPERKTSGKLFLKFCMQFVAQHSTLIAFARFPCIQFPLLTQVFLAIYIHKSCVYNFNND